MAESAGEGIIERRRLQGGVQASGTLQMQRGIIARVDKRSWYPTATYRIMVRDKRRRKDNELYEHAVPHSVHSTLSQQLFFEPGQQVNPTAAGSVANWHCLRQNVASATAADVHDIVITPLGAGDRYS